MAGAVPLPVMLAVSALAVAAVIFNTSQVSAAGITCCNMQKVCCCCDHHCLWANVEPLGCHLLHMHSVHVPTQGDALHPPDISLAQVIGLFDWMGAAGAAAWSRWQAFLGCLGFAVVPQALALAVAAPAAATSAAPATLGAALGVALSAAIMLPSTAHSHAAAAASPAQPRSDGQRASGEPSRLHTVDVRRSFGLGSREAGSGQGAQAAARAAGLGATCDGDSAGNGSNMRSYNGGRLKPRSGGAPKQAEASHVRWISASSRHSSTRHRGTVSDEDGEPGLGRWQPFWATVPAWSATLLLMLEPVKLLVCIAQLHQGHRMALLTQRPVGTVLPLARSAGVAGASANVAHVYSAVLLDSMRSSVLLCRRLLSLGGCATQAMHVAGRSPLACAGITAPLLACAGNALLVPRALRLRNGMFLTATTWGTAGSWLVAAASLGASQVR